MQGKLQALILKNRLDWQTLPGTNSLAYFAEASVSKKKGFIRLGKYHNRVAKVEGGEGESNIKPVANIRA